ncbi:MAG: C39 family peptidase [Chloroflexi bacterium]|nr:C39 family peptidase [Chloroflexota bacterium]
MRPQNLLAFLLTFTVVALLTAMVAFIIYNIPAVNERLAPRVENLWSQLSGQKSAGVETLPTASFKVTPPPTFALESPTDISQPTQSPIPNLQSPTQKLSVTLVPTRTLAPAPTSPPLVTANLPSSYALSTSRREPQLFNNCGPATLVGALTYWGWRGSETDNLTWGASGKDIRWQKEIAAVIKPGASDKNVMPYDMADFAIKNAGLRAQVRYGGTLEMLKLLIANGFPVIIERGFRENEHGQVGEGWEGHYSFIKGYDDGKKIFITQDTFKWQDINYPRSYDDIAYDWRSFNYIYLVVYPASREGQLMTLLGADADTGTNLIRTLAIAQAETQKLTDPLDLTFAWHNVGSTLQLIRRSKDAAAAFDQSRSYGVFPKRMLWYQTEMYKAYYNEKRYQEVIDLATITLKSPKVPGGLEESFYWRSWSYYQLGNKEAAYNDMRAALQTHPDWSQALAAFAEWGVKP